MTHRRNRGWFRKGSDPRRHEFSEDECRRGGRAGFAAVMERRPECLLWLKKRLKRQGRWRPYKGEPAAVA